MDKTQVVRDLVNRFDRISVIFAVRSGGNKSIVTVTGLRLSLVKANGVVPFHTIRAGPAPLVGISCDLVSHMKLCNAFAELDDFP
jgi:hypothetical protein